MLTVEDLRFFAAISAAASLAEAARSLDVTPPAVTRRLQTLESRLGIRLVERTTRRLTLTAEGRILANRGGAVLLDIEDIVDDLAQRRQEVTGHLRVVAPFGFGRRFIAPATEQFSKAYPSASVTLHLFDNPLRQKAEGWDAVVYVGDPPESGLVVRQLAPNQPLLCAAPAYLARYGRPSHPGELAAHRCLVLRDNDEDATLWTFTAAGDGPDTVAVRVRPFMASNDGEVIKSWGFAGLGIIMRSEWDVAEDFVQGRLVRLLPEWQLPAANIYVSFGKRQGRAARTRQFVGILERMFKPVPWRKIS